MGRGTFAIIICILMSVVCCFFKNSSIFPNCVVFMAVLLPVIVFLIIYWAPKESLSSDKTKEDLLPTSWYFVKTMFFTGVIFFVFVVSILTLLMQRFRIIQVRRIDSEVGNDKKVVTSNMDKKGYEDASSN